MKLKLNSKLLLTGFVILLSMALIARDVFSISVNKFIVLGICTVFLFAADETARLSMISFLLPLMCGIPSTYVLLVILILFAMRNRLKPMTIVLFVVFIMLEFIALSYVRVSLSSTLIKQLLFICVFFSMLFTVEKIDYRQCLVMYFIGALLVCFVIDAYSILRAPDNWMEQFAKGWYRFGNVALEDVDGMTLRLNPNSLAYFSMSGLFVGLILVARSRGLLRGVYIAGTVFLAVSGILSVSRTWIFVTGGCIALLMLSYCANPRHIGIALLIAGSVVVAVWLVQRYYPDLLAGMTTRMTSSTLEGGNGRVDLMYAYLEAMLSDPRIFLLGTGATHYKLIVAAENSVHNGTLQIFMSYGIFGGCFFIGGMLYPLVQIWKSCRVKLISWLPFIGIVLYAQTIQFINPCYLMMPYVIAIYAIYEGKIYG